MKKHIYRLLAASALLLSPLGAASVMAEVPGWAQQIDPHQFGGNYYCYPWLNAEPPALTPAPKGYKPFHIEHYGRHGSRWLIGTSAYDNAVAELEKAERNGKLTPLGQQVLDVARTIRTASQGRDGELSDLGALQHQGIGRRMVRNFPQVFTPATHVDAKSTVVIRSILSMFNGLSGIQSQVPGILITTDASEADMNYMNHSEHAVKKGREKFDKEYGKPYKSARKSDGSFLARLVNDPQFAADSIRLQTLYSGLYSVLVNAQSHSDQPWLFEEVFPRVDMLERWLSRNANWFVRSGNTALNGNIGPYNQNNLMRNIIESADTAVNSTRHSVNLRYGHDTIVLPLAVLMELDDLGQEINSLEELGPLGWHDYKVIPMAANIQIVLYRKDASTDAGDVLVKVLLNEREARLPLQAVEGPYYRWTDFRNHYLGKIDRMQPKLSSKGAKDE